MKKSPRFALPLRLLCLAGFVVMLQSQSTGADLRFRREIPFPDLPGFVTLRCDFHLHTVFSDGNVWPAFRVEEAWRTGLDAIALTDHIEYQPHKQDVPTKHGRSHELARPSAAGLGLLLIQAAEITRGEPPGHLNALFLTNVAALDHTNYRVAVSNAAAQGAFLFWNHPAWKQPDKKAVWYAEQNEFHTNGFLRGLEVVNGDDYDAIVHEWCVAKDLALMGNSDAHDPVAFDVDYARGEIRPMTLVFARERTPEALKEALFAARTVVFSQGKLYGKRDFLEPLFQNSIQILNPRIVLRGKSKAAVQIRNNSAVDFELRLNPKLPELDVQERAVLKAGAVSLVNISCVSERVTGTQVVSLPCRVLNLHTAPTTPLRTKLSIPVQYE